MPSTTSSLLSAIILTLVFVLMWRHYRERWLGLWAVAAALWVARYLLAIVVEDQVYRSGARLLPVIALARGWFLLWGAYALVRRPMPRAWAVLFALDAGILVREWVAGAVLIGGVPGVTHYLLFGVATIVAGLVLLFARRQFGRERVLVGSGLLLMGAVNAAYPWAFRVPANQPWMMLLVHTSQLAIGFGALVLFYRRANAERDATLVRVEHALSKAITGHLPICAHCKSVEEPAGEWESLERYFHRRHDAAFSHGICPSCEEQHYGDLLRGSGMPVTAPSPVLS